MAQQLSETRALFGIIDWRACDFRMAAHIQAWYRPAIGDTRNTLLALIENIIQALTNSGVPHAPTALAKVLRTHVNNITGMRAGRRSVPKTTPARTAAWTLASTCELQASIFSTLNAHDKRSVQINAYGSARAISWWLATQLYPGFNPQKPTAPKWAADGIAELLGNWAEIKIDSAETSIYPPWSHSTPRVPKSIAIAVCNDAERRLGLTRHDLQLALVETYLPELQRGIDALEREGGKLASLAQKDAIEWRFELDAEYADLLRHADVAANMLVRTSLGAHQNDAR